jgi:hypothetical protein
VAGRAPSRSPRAARRRGGGPPDAGERALADDLRAHERLLGALRLTPADLHERTDLGTALGWGARRVPLLAAGAVTALGVRARLAGPTARPAAAAARVPGADAADVRATAKFLVGAAVFAAWAVLLAAAAGAAAWRAAGWGWGLAAAAFAAAAAPALAVYALRTAEGWRAARRDARRFLRLRGRAARVAELRARQRVLAARVEAAVAGEPPHRAGVDAPAAAAGD